MREALKTSVSKYGPKTDSSITVENVAGKGLQLVVMYAGRKHYLPLSSMPLNQDTHANHPNHQKIRVDHSGQVGIGIATPTTRLNVQEDSTTNEIFKITDTGTNTTASCFIIPFEMPSTTENQRCDIQVGGAGRYLLCAMSNNNGRYLGFVYISSSTANATVTTIGTANNITVGSDSSGANKIRITNTYAGAAVISGVLIALDSYGTLTVGSVA